MNYQERAAARRAADGERRAKQQESTRDDFYSLPFEERARLRSAEAEGRRQGQERAAIEEQAKRQAELDATPEHERRPPNHWRQLIELRKPDAWRKDVARRIKVYEREAKIEDERIDRMMAEKKRQHELESQPEYAKALAHWDRAHVAAETEEERQEWARLKGIVEANPSAYWDDVAPIMQARLAKVQERWNGQVAKQAAVVSESKALAAEVENVTALASEAAPPEPQEESKEE